MKKVFDIVSELKITWLKDTSVFFYTHIKCTFTDSYCIWNGKRISKYKEKTCECHSWIAFILSSLNYEKVFSGYWLKGKKSYHSFNHEALKIADLLKLF